MTRLVRLVLSLAVVLVIAACGPGGGGGAQPDGPAATQAPAATPDDGY